MRNRIGVIFVIWSVVLMAPGMGESQRGGGREGGDRERFEAMRARMEAIQAVDIEPLWGVLSLKIGMTDPQTVQLKQLFQVVMTERDRLLSDVKEEWEDEDWEPLISTLKERRKTFDKQLTEILTDEQENKLAAWQKEREKWRIGFGSRAGWPGRGMRR